MSDDSYGELVKVNRCSNTDRELQHGRNKGREKSMLVLVSAIWEPQDMLIGMVYTLCAALLVSNCASKKKKEAKVRVCDCVAGSGVRLPPRGTSWISCKG
ncbi:hypothetical protein WR25_04577 [Diploscapter pachys]|uniref:Uncharacterized protein n=1 Tax=Diploscapter pachys TaxID=2018661 RepID=A0A2A2LL46_9BILA|nr:hypothetical protein WR25_04577 [Diploscapter pachys]